MKRRDRDDECGTVALDNLKRLCINPETTDCSDNNGIDMETDSVSLSSTLFDDASTGIFNPSKQKFSSRIDEIVDHMIRKSRRHIMYQSSSSSEIVPNSLQVYIPSSIGPSPLLDMRLTSGDSVNLRRQIVMSHTEIDNNYLDCNSSKYANEISHSDWFQCDSERTQQSNCNNCNRDMSDDDNEYNCDDVIMT